MWIGFEEKVAACRSVFRSKVLNAHSKAWNGCSKALNVHSKVLNEHFLGLQKDLLRDVGTIRSQGRKKKTGEGRACLRPPLSEKLSCSRRLID